MPPFVNTSCVYKECQKPNRYDLAVLRKKNGSLFKGVVIGGKEVVEEFEVTCQHCGRKFKFTVKGG